MSLYDRVYLLKDLSDQGLKINLKKNHQLNGNGWRAIEKLKNSGQPITQAQLDQISSVHDKMSKHDSVLDKVGDEISSAADSIGNGITKVVREVAPVVGAVYGGIVGGPAGAMAGYNFGNSVSDMSGKVHDGETLHFTDYRNVVRDGIIAYYTLGGASGMSDVGYAMQNTPQILSEYGQNASDWVAAFKAAPVDTLVKSGKSLAEAQANPQGAGADVLNQMGLPGDKIMAGIQAAGGFTNALGGVANAAGGNTSGGVPGGGNTQAAAIMQAATDSAKRQQQQGYADANNFLTGGRDSANQVLLGANDLARKDLVAGRDQGRTDLYDAMGQARNDLFAGRDMARTDLTSAEQRGGDLFRGTVDQSRKDVAPWYQGGQQALGQQMSLLGLGPQGGPSASSILEGTPGYQWAMEQGLKGLQNQIGASGLGISGAADKARMKYAAGLASQTFNDRLSQLSQLSGLGAQMGNQMGQNQMALGQTLNNNAMSTGTNLANTATGTATQLSNNGINVGTNLANMAFGTGQQLGQNQMTTGAGVANNQFNTGTAQSTNAMNNASQLGGYDLFGGALQASASLHNNGSPGNMSTLDKWGNRINQVGNTINSLGNLYSSGQNLWNMFASK